MFRLNDCLATDRQGQGTLDSHWLRLLCVIPTTLSWWLKVFKICLRVFLLFRCTESFLSPCTTPLARGFGWIAAVTWSWERLWSVLGVRPGQGNWSYNSCSLCFCDVISEAERTVDLGAFSIQQNRARWQHFHIVKLTSSLRIKPTK
jgi:hypothetical protein